MIHLLRQLFDRTDDLTIWQAAQAAREVRAKLHASIEAASKAREAAEIYRTWLENALRRDNPPENGDPRPGGKY